VVKQRFGNVRRRRGTGQIGVDESFQAGDLVGQPTGGLDVGVQPSLDDFELLSEVDDGAPERGAVKGGFFEANWTAGTVN
jgi:hypothetical protein